MCALPRTPFLRSWVDPDAHVDITLKDTWRLDLFSPGEEAAEDTSPFELSPSYSESFQDVRQAC